jgi:enoyl-CoA hydratase
MTSFTDVVFSIANGHGRIMLNRPQALNALTLPMIDAMDSQLRAWAANDSVGAIIITGAGDKAFCVGGDIKALHAARMRGDMDYLEQFYRREYTFNYRLATYPKPIIAVMDGITMGGGAGIAFNCSHPVATDQTVFAMPECRIGLFPDVGAGRFLNKATRAVALATGLIGLSLRGPDLIRLGLADRYIGAAPIEEIGIDGLDALNQPVAAAAVDRILPQIDAIFGHATCDEIMSALAAARGPWAEEVQAQFGRSSPTSLKITFAHLARGRGRSLADTLAVEFRLAQHCMRGHDFFEGVRAQLIDKDGAPKWQPDTLAGVTDAMVDTCFSAVPGIGDWSPPAV